MQDKKQGLNQQQQGQLQGQIQDQQYLIQTQKKGEVEDLKTFWKGHPDIENIYNGFSKIDTSQNKELFAKSLEDLRQRVYGACFKDEQDSQKAKANAQKVLFAIAQDLQANGVGKQTEVDVGECLCRGKVFTLILTSADQEMLSPHGLENVPEYRTLSQEERAKWANGIQYPMLQVAHPTLDELQSPSGMLRTTLSNLKKANDKDGEYSVGAIQILAHGITRDIQQLGSSQNIPDQGKKRGDMVLAQLLDGAQSITAQQLFKYIGDAQRESHIGAPLFISTNACFSGQARNDMHGVGLKNAMLITPIGRKYPGYYEHSYGFMPKKNEVEMRHTGPLQLIKDRVINGAGFNISLTDDQGRQIFWDKQGKKLAYVSSDVTNSLLSVNGQQVDVTKPDILKNKDVKNSIKGEVTLKELCSLVSSKEENAVKKFKQYIKGKYEKIVDQIPESLLKEYGYSSAKEAKASIDDIKVTRTDLYKYLLTACSSILLRDSTQTNQPSKSKQALIGATDPEISKFVGWAEEILSVKPNDPILPGFVSLLMKNSSFLSEIDKDPQNGPGKVFQVFFGNGNDGRLKVLQDVGKQMINDSIKYRAIVAYARTLRADDINALGAAASKLGEPYFRQLCNAAFRSGALAQNVISLLSSDNATSLPFDKYQALCNVAPSRGTYQINALLTPGAKSLSDAQYQALCAAAPKLAQYQVEALCLSEVRNLGFTQYKDLCDAHIKKGVILKETLEQDIKKQIDTKKLAVLCSKDAMILNDTQYKVLCIAAPKLALPQMQTLCSALHNNLIGADKITALCSKEAVQTGDAQYQKLCEIAQRADIDWERYGAICSLASQLTVDKMTVLADVTPQLGMGYYKIRALSSENASKLPLDHYKALCEVAPQLGGDKIEALSSQGAGSLSIDKYKALCQKVYLKIDKLNLDQIKQEISGQQGEALQQQPEKLQQQNQQNLRKYGKGEGESEMMGGLVKANVGKEMVLEEMREKASGEVKVDERKDGAKKSGKVELMGEVHDQHGASVRKLVEKMERDEMGAGTVVALERKEGGEHLGMRDVRLLAEVMRHNEGCKEDERVALPAGIEGTALWWDAKLVNAAQKHGVQVVGVEGKGLAHGQHSPKYNADREDYMVQKLHQLQRQGYNVVMPVGEAHVRELQARLSVNAAMEAMRNIMQQNNVQIGQDKGQRLSQHPATIDVKQTYGKFTAQSARGSSNNRGIA